MLTRRVASYSRPLIALSFAVLLLAVSCGKSETVTGLYKHPSEGTVTVQDGDKAIFEQSGKKTEASYTVADDTITFTIGKKTAKARHSGKSLIFEKGAYSGGEEETFTAE